MRNNQKITLKKLSQDNHINMTIKFHTIIGNFGHDYSKLKPSII